MTPGFLWRQNPCYSNFTYCINHQLQAGASNYFPPLKLLKPFLLLGVLLKTFSTLLPLHVCRASLEFVSAHGNSNNTNEMTGNLIKNKQQQNKMSRRILSSYWWSSYWWFLQQCIFHTSFLFHFNMTTTFIQDDTVYLDLSKVCNLGHVLESFWEDLKTLVTQVVPQIIKSQSLGVVNLSDHYFKNGSR